MKKKVSILGSTGSIGKISLQIFNKKKNLFKISFLSADKNFKTICEQIKKYKPDFFLVNNIKVYKKVSKKFKKNKVKIINNIKKLKTIKFDITIAAIPGIAGLAPTIHMMKTSKKILIANKEAIICGWELIKKEARKNNTKIIPIDSEHYSIFNLLQNYKINDVDKIFITASGGPFLNLKPKDFKKIKPKDAIQHPKWKMGKKISVDSSTLMNKILELIEAQKIFNISSKKIEILIHPQSLVHAIIKFKNGLSKIIYHDTSMSIPIANAIFDEKIDISEILSRNILKKKIVKTLKFDEVQKSIFPIITIKKHLNEFPSTSIIINSSNEVLVEQFLRKKLPFLGIAKTIKAILKDRNYRKYAIKRPSNINEILKIDEWSRKATMLKMLKNND